MIPPHSHTVELTDTTGRLHVVQTSADPFDHHSHELRLTEAFALQDGSVLPVGTTVTLEVMDAHDDHRHTGRLGEGETAFHFTTGHCYPLIVTGDFQAVFRSAFGTTASLELPESLKADVPPSLRYWECDDDSTRVEKRDALTRSGILDQVAEVDDELRLIVCDGDARFLRAATNSDLVALKDSQELAAEHHAGRFLSVEVVQLCADAAGVSAQQHIESILSTSQIPVVVECDRVPTSLRSIAWRPTYARKWLVSTSAPPTDEDVKFLVETPSADVSLLRQKRATGEMGTMPALASWVATHRDDHRASSMLSFVVEKEMAQDSPSRPVLDALGVEDASLPSNIVKSFGQTAPRIEMICKSEQRREITYIVFNPVADLHADLMTPVEIRKTAEGYIRFCRKIGLHHDNALELTDAQVSLTGHWVFDEETVMHGKQILEGAWLVKFKYHDADLWVDAASGRFGGVSPQGMAQRLPIESE